MRADVTVVIPVRGQSALLDGCLESLARQSLPLRVTVIDDSDDGSLAVLPGVEVLRSGGRGPYAARNIGTRAATGDLVMFVDARSRPRPTWAAELAACFEDPSVVFAGSDIEIRDTGSFAARLARARQIFSVDNYFPSSFHLPYFPTCNLAVRRQAVEAAGGFKESRSGADADLCWRLLALPGATAACAPGVLMDWVPRDRFIDLVEQFHRYGRSNHALRSAWRTAGVPQDEGQPLRNLLYYVPRTLKNAAVALVRRDDERLVEAGVFALHLAYQSGLRMAHHRHRRSPASP